MVVVTSAIATSSRKRARAPSRRPVRSRHCGWLGPSGKARKNPAKLMQRLFAETPARVLPLWGDSERRKCRRRSSRALHALLAGATPLPPRSIQGFCCRTSCHDLPTSQLQRCHHAPARAQAAASIRRTERRPPAAARAATRRRDRRPAPPHQRVFSFFFPLGGSGCSLSPHRWAGSPDCRALGHEPRRLPADRWPHDRHCRITRQAGAGPGLMAVPLTRAWSPAALPLGRMPWCHQQEGRG